MKYANCSIRSVININKYLHKIICIDNILLILPFILFFFKNLFNPSRFMTYKKS